MYTVFVIILQNSTVTDTIIILYYTKRYPEYIIFLEYGNKIYLDMKKIC